MVDIVYSPERSEVRAEVSGELDHCRAADLRAAIDLEIMKRVPRTLVLDLSQLAFMDSSGIGLIIGRCKLMTDLGGTVIAVNPQPEVRKIMELAGVQRLCSIVRSERRSLIGGLTI